jgi:hypothetical protein
LQKGPPNPGASTPGQARSKSCDESAGTPHKVTDVLAIEIASEVFFEVTATRYPSLSLTLASSTTTVPKTLKPNRAGTLGGGCMLKTGKGPRTGCEVPLLLLRTVIVPTCAVDGHDVAVDNDASNASCAPLQRSAFGGAPPNPAGDVTEMFLTGSTGQPVPPRGTGLVKVLKSIFTVMSAGCAAACVTAFPSVSETKPSKASIPNSGGISDTVTGSTVLAAGAPPPDTANCAERLPAALGLTLTLRRTSRYCT